MVDPQIETPPTRVGQRKVIWPILFLVILGAVLIALDREQIIQVLSQADWHAIPYALFFTAVSYLCVSYNYSIIAHMIGIRLGSRILSEICFVTTVINHVIRSAGVAGYSIRYLLMSQRGVNLPDIVSSSVLHYYLTSLDMLIMLPVALAYLLLQSDVPSGVTALLGLMTLFMLTIAVIGTMLIFSDSLRSNLVTIGTRLGKKILRRDFNRTMLDLNQHFSAGVLTLKRHPGTSAFALSLTFIDWVASVIVLGYCFDAFGPPVKAGAVVSIFVLGIMAGVVSAIPGGIGVQEGTMTGVAMLLGATFEQAILAALLFRVVYYFIPYFVSPLFYWRLLREPARDYTT